MTIPPMWAFLLGVKPPILREQCPRPHCKGNLVLEYDEDTMVKKCMLCERSWNMDGSEIKPPKLRKRRKSKLKSQR